MMQIIRARNVNEAYSDGRELLEREGNRSTSRGGDVLVVPYPVVTVYERPAERVLFDPVRDANPFFHLFESLWMLAGRDDAEFLDKFVRDFGARFAEAEGHIHGAYGRRWRDWFPLERAAGADDGPCDQLDVVVRLLRADPDSRQAVLQMWDAQADLGVPGLLDRPCNTQVYLQVRREDGTGAADSAHEVRVLDLTVTCRSNDIVWGAYGANAVHFSVLQEYLAGRIGVGVGALYQFSNNWHGYVNVLTKMPRPAGYGTDVYRAHYAERLGVEQVRPLPMGTDWDRWDRDNARLIWWIDGAPYHAGIEETPVFVNKWFATTAVPMFLAHRAWREGNIASALATINVVEASDWRLAARQWLGRRAGA